MGPWGLPHKNPGSYHLLPEVSFASLGNRTKKWDHGDLNPNLPVSSGKRYAGLVIDLRLIAPVLEPVILAWLYYGPNKESKE